MKNLSLTVKLWLGISLVSLLLYLFVLIVTPSLIRDFFINNMMEQSPDGPKIRVEESVNDRGTYIRSFILLKDGTTLPAKARQGLQPAFINEVIENAKSQQSHNQLYQSKSGSTPIRYVIVKDQAYGHPIYQIKFLRKPEEDRFVRDFLFNIMLYVGLALIVSWFVSLFIVRYLTRPLTLMGHHVRRIANRNWHEPLDIKRNDEIGELANSIDSMRRQLIEQDETQQSMLQNISHELKTPVMVIRSYAQAINDGVYPKGNLNGSIEVIDEEGERLEKLIKQLLYLTRLDYLANKKQPPGNVQLDQLIEKTVQRLHPQRSAIALQLDLQPVIVMGDEETLRVMVENLFDNHLRFAHSQIKIDLNVDSEQIVLLSFWNDGSRISPNVVNDLFKPFQKGREGKYGLGLTIVQRILKMYQGEITLTNENEGVSTKVKIPMNSIRF